MFVMLYESLCIFIRIDCNSSVGSNGIRECFGRGVREGDVFVY